MARLLATSVVVCSLLALAQGARPAAAAPAKAAAATPKKDDKKKADAGAPE
ncbi:MAG: hypothetical protein H6Q89_999, partial [Myxococcaceae bacterium]|nr:hypothetical protein [Myxococcaceae bacterium]